MNFIIKAASTCRDDQRFLGQVLLGVSGLSVILASWNYLQAESA